MVVILPILLERQWRWPSTILSGEPLFYLEPLLIRLFSSLFSGPPPLIRGGAPYPDTRLAPEGQNPSIFTMFERLGKNLYYQGTGSETMRERLFARK